ncbi:MAG TPA: GIY-YIG nuclease family protein [Bryobacteraceae bacterium]|nr:GIY-YIG nuclease family protein [Bryobacteraceae bacterium]
MDKQHILEEIRRTAKANGGKPLGLARFYEATGIREWDWRGKHWENFGDAQEEAGFERNTKQEAYDEALLIEKLVTLMRELKRFPTVAALRIKRRSDPSFPASETFRRFGKEKEQRAEKIRSYCMDQPGYEDVIEICEAVTRPSTSEETEEHKKGGTFGFVYLMKSGRYYKIGRTNHVGGRERDLGIQLPEKIKTLHSIRTDDPVGIEKYWHNRFKPKQKNSEWFDLNREDIAAFRRRKFM